LYSGVQLTPDRTRQQVTIWDAWQGQVGALTLPTQDLGGWTLDVHHTYESRSGILYLGNGEQRHPEGLSQQITTVVGTPQGSTADGIPATQARIGPPNGLALGPDGSIYISDGARIRRVGPDGIISTVAGTGTGGYSGDGGLAT